MHTPPFTVSYRYAWFCISNDRTKICNDKRPKRKRGKQEETKRKRREERKSKKEKRKIAGKKEGRQRKKRRPRKESGKERGKASICSPGLLFEQIGIAKVSLGNHEFRLLHVRNFFKDVATFAPKELTSQNVQEYGGAWNTTETEWGPN